MIRIIIIVLTLVTLYAWFSLPDRSWAVLGPNVVIGAIQLIIGLTITEILLSYGRQRRFKDIAGYDVGHCMTDINVTLYVYANNFSLSSALKKLKEIQPNLGRLSERVGELQERYQGLIDFETNSTLEEIKKDLWGMSISEHKSTDDLLYVANSVEGIHKNVRTLGKRYSYQHWIHERDPVISNWVKKIKSR